MEDNKKPSNTPIESSSDEILDAEIDEKEEAVLTKLEDDTVEDDADLSPEEKAYLKTLKDFAENGNGSLVSGNKTLTPMSKSKERKLKRDENHIVTERGVKLRTDTELSKLNKDHYELCQSVKSNKILKGTITSVVVNPEQNSYYAMVSFGFNTYKILIPSQALFRYNYQDLPNDEGAKQRISKRISSMIGAEIEFVCYHVDKNQRLAIADRLKALEILGKQYYITIPKGQERPLVFKDIIAEGRVIAVSKSSVTISVLGADRTLTLTPNDEGYNEVSWGRPSDCRDEFKVGDTQLVKILSVDRRRVEMPKKYNLIFAEMSLRQAKPDPMKQYFKDIQQNAKYLAKVTSVTDSGVFVNIEPYNVTCLIAFPKYGATPEIGDKIVITITGKEIEKETGKHRIYGVRSR